MKRLIALSLSIAFACAQKQPQEAPGVPDGEIWLSKEMVDKGQARIASAAETDLPQAVVAPGRIAFDDLRVVHVFSPVTGRLTRVLAQPGQRVQKGTPLAAIASPDLGSAAADLIKARADLTAAKHELDRQRKLAEAHAGSQRDLETAQDNHDKAKAEEARALQRVRMFRSGSIDSITQEYILKSPIAGHVISRSANPGIEVQGQYSGGTAVELFTVGNIDRVWAVADVAESDLPQVELGADASIAVIAYPDNRYRGRVEWIAGALDPALRTGKVRASLDNSKGELKPEMFAMISIARPPRRALAIPAKALMMIGDQPFVYAAADKQSRDGREIFRRRRIRVGEDAAGARKEKARPLLEMRMVASETEQLVSVVDGLKAGERVLVQEAGAREAGNEEAAVSEEQLDAAGIAVEPVLERDVSDAVLTGARLSFDDLRVAHVFSPVTGRVLRVLAAPGAAVKKGAPLAVISSPDLAAAQADLAKAKADRVAAEHEARRQKELSEAGAGALRDYQIAQDNLAKAIAEDQRAALKSRLLLSGAGAGGEYVLHSPIDGRVIARNLSPGSEVQGQYSGGNPAVELFTIGNAAELWVLADVYEMDLSRVRRGQQVTIHAQGHDYSGAIDWISDTLDPVMRTAKVRCTIDNEAGLLRPESYQEVRISVTGKPVLTVPRAALLRMGEEVVVFVAGERDKEGRRLFKRRRVLAREGFSSGLVPVLAGVALGERVVTRGAIFLAGAL